MFGSPTMPARRNLRVLEDAVQDILNRTTDAFRKGDLHMAGKVEPLEAVVNELVLCHQGPPCGPFAGGKLLYLSMVLCWKTC